MTNFSVFMPRDLYRLPWRDRDRMLYLAGKRAGVFSSLFWAGVLSGLGIGLWVAAVVVFLLRQTSDADFGSRGTFVYLNVGLVWSSTTLFFLAGYLRNRVLRRSVREVMAEEYPSLPKSD